MSTNQSQQEFLRTAKDELGLDWDTLALKAGIAPRALKNYRLPASSAGHRALPSLARAAVEALLADARSAGVQTQQDLLRCAKTALSVTWDELANQAGISPRALKNWRLPTTSANYRKMPSLARAAIERVMHAARQY